MRKSLKIMSSICAAALGVTMLTGIAAAQDRKVRIAYGVAVVDPSTAPWLTAGKTGGYWQEEGLDVEVTGYQGAGPALQLLAQGQADIVFTGTPDMMRLREEGVNIKCVANVYDRMHVYPVVLPDSPIETIEDFKGKNVGLQALTGSVRVWTDLLLKSHDMTIEDLGGAIAVGTGAAAVQALQSGQIDALIEWHGHYALLETQFGLEFRRFDDDPALSENSFVHCVHASDKLIEEEPEVVEGILRGMAKGIIFAQENPEAVVAGHFEQYPRTLPQGVSREQAIKDAAAVVAQNVQLSAATSDAGEWGIASQEQVERVRDALVESGTLNESMSWENYYTSQFIEAANDFDREAVTAKAREAGN